MCRSLIMLPLFPGASSYRDNADDRSNHPVLGLPGQTTIIITSGLIISTLPFLFLLVALSAWVFCSANPGSSSFASAHVARGRRKLRPLQVYTLWVVSWWDFQSFRRVVSPDPFLCCRCCCCCLVGCREAGHGGVDRLMAASGGGSLLERRSSVRRSQSMVSEEGRGTPADEDLGGCGTLKIGAVLDKDSAEPKSRLAKDTGEHGGGGPSGKSSP